MLMMKWRTMKQSVDTLTIPCVILFDVLFLALVETSGEKKSVRMSILHVSTVQYHNKHYGARHEYIIKRLGQIWY